MDFETAREIMRLRQMIERLQLPELGAQPKFLSSPLTNTTFDGDSFSTVAANTKIENTSWSSTIPANAKALILRIDAADSDSANSNSWFGVYNASGATALQLVARCYGLPNDARGTAHGVVACTDGYIWYQCLASGASTLDVWMWCLGYYL